MYDTLKFVEREKIEYNGYHFTTAVCYGGGEGSEDIFGAFTECEPWFFFMGSTREKVVRQAKSAIDFYIETWDNEFVGTIIAIATCNPFWVVTLDKPIADRTLVMVDSGTLGRRDVIGLGKAVEGSKIGGTFKIGPDALAATRVWPIKELDG